MIPSEFFEDQITSAKAKLPATLVHESELTLSFFISNLNKADIALFWVTIQSAYTKGQLDKALEITRESLKNSGIMPKSGGR